MLKFVGLLSALGLVAACQPQAKQEDEAPGLRLVEAGKHPLTKAHVVNLQQIERPFYQERMRVSTANAFTEEYIAPQKPDDTTPLDILLVIDNSGSMSEEQENLATKIRPLLSAIENRAWQINVITTDNPCAATNLPLTPETPDYEAVFAEAVKVGISGSGWEQGLQMAYSHLLGIASCLPRPWLREGAKLDIIFLSDEPDQSGITPEAFIDALVGLGYTSGETLATHSIVGLPDVPCPVAEPDENYLATSAITAGLIGNICAADYSEILLQISEHLADINLPEIKLARVPDPQSLRITLNGADYAQGYHLVNDVIVLKYQLASGDVVRVDYKDRSDRYMQLLRPIPDLTTLLVTIDAVAVSPDDYSYEAATNGIRFKQSLAEHSHVLVTYRSGADLQQEFKFGQNISGPVECYLEEVPLATSYDSERGLITVAPPPPDGAGFYCLYANRG